MRCVIAAAAAASLFISFAGAAPSPVKVPELVPAPSSHQTAVPAAAPAAAQDSEKNPYLTSRVTDVSDPRAYSRTAVPAFYAALEKGNFVPPFQAPAGYTLKRLGGSTQSAGAELLTPPNPHPTRVILRFHGGGYVAGLTDLYRYLAVQESRAAGNARVYLLDYSLAPAAQYPVALNQALTLYRAMLSQNIRPENIVVMGDSAGANLAMSFMLTLRDQKASQPAGVVLISPWAEMRNDLPSRIQNYEKDLILGKGTPMYGIVKTPNYTGRENYAVPYVSPLNGSFAGLSPILLQAGGDELFLSDAAEVYAKAKAEGTDAVLTVYPGFGHDFPLVMPELRASRSAWKEAGDFAIRVTSGKKN